ncbi:MAG: DUF1501 domain-containing protein [Chthoniobacter sp.]
MWRVPSPSSSASSKGGLRYEATDALGEHTVDGAVDAHALHATILHLRSLSLTYRYAGRDFRLTDVPGKVAREIMT